MIDGVAQRRARHSGGEPGRGSAAVRRGFASRPPTRPSNGFVNQAVVVIDQHLGDLHVSRRSLNRRDLQSRDDHANRALMARVRAARTRVSIEPPLETRIDTP